MNPETGKFVAITSGIGCGKLIAEREDIGAIPDEWPIFTIGDTFVLQGVSFELVRVNLSTIVLRPVVPDVSARKALDKMVSHG